MSFVSLVLHHVLISVRLVHVNYSSAVGAGFYGNEETNKGLRHFIEAADDVRETILGTESQVHLSCSTVIAYLILRTVSPLT